MHPASAATAEEAVAQLARMTPGELVSLNADIRHLASLAAAATAHYHQLLAIHGITGIDYAPAIAPGSAIRA